MKNQQIQNLEDLFIKEKAKNNTDSLVKCSALASVLWNQHLDELKRELEEDWDFFEDTLAKAKLLISKENYFIDISQSSLLISQNGKLIFKTKPYNPKELALLIFGKDDVPAILELLLYQKELFLLFNLFFQKSESKTDLLSKDDIEEE